MLWLFALLSSTQAGLLIDKLAASINKNSILQSDVLAFRSTFNLRMQLDPLLSGTALGKQGAQSSDAAILEFLIEEALIQEIYPSTPSEVEQEIAAIEAANQTDRKSLEQALAAQNFTFSQYHTLIGTILAKRSLVDREIRQKVAITDTDLKNYFYNHYVKKTSTPRSFHIQLLLLSADRFKSKALALTAITRAFNELRSGESFEQVARNTGEDASKTDLGYLTEDHMTHEIREKLAKMEIGDISPIFTVDEGTQYAIVKLKDIKIDNEEQFGKLRDQIRSELSEKEFQRHIQLWLEKQKEQAAIHRSKG